MKAYPLIYSRTKTVDFVPDFLARPDDLDWQKALEYVENAMLNLDSLQTVRYTTFSVGNYCICGGIACLSRILVQQLKNESSSFPNILLNNVDDYLSDCKGRSLACFIGFAIPKSQVKQGNIPEIKLEEYWKMYLEYLKKQWLSSTTESEKLKDPTLSLNDKIYTPCQDPVKECIQKKGIVLNFAQNTQETLDYYFDQIINHNSEESFISEIQHKEEWDQLCFKNVAVSDQLYNSLKKPIVQDNQNEQMGSVLGKVGKDTYKSPTGTRQDDGSQKKTAFHPLGISLAVVALVIILIILIIKGLRR